MKQLTNETWYILWSLNVNRVYSSIKTFAVNTPDNVHISNSDLYNLETK